MHTNARILHVLHCYAELAISSVAKFPNSSHYFSHATVYSSMDDVCGLVL